MARARKGSLIQSKLCGLLFGEPFTGKSTMAMQLAYFKRSDGKPFRVLYLDPENGSIDDYLEELQENGVDLDNIYIVYTQSVGEVREYIRKSRENEDLYELDDDGNETDVVVLDADGEPFRADAIVVDGASILNLTTKQGLVEFSKKRAKVKADRDGLIGDEKLVKVEGAGLELKDYQTVNFKGQDLILDLMGSGKHFIVTARETAEKVQKELNGKSESVATGRMIPEGFKGMDYNVKTLIRMYRDEDGSVKAEVRKDRTGVHKDCEIVDDPNLLDWQVIIDKSANRKEFVIQNNLNQAVEIEQNIYKKEILGEDTQTEKTESSNGAESLDSIRSEIKQTLASLSPVVKAQKKKILQTKGLNPTEYTKINDITQLKTILDELKK
jgi:hypothetical protein